jgi:hypothetical protein
MNIIELSEELVSRIHCPFCGTEVTNEEKVPDIDTCPHTLFVATSEGFEFISERLKAIAELQSIGDPYLIGHETVIDKLHLSSSLCFVINPMPPSMLALYIGFAPLETDS